MSRTKATTTVIKQEFELPGEEARIRLALALPFFLPLDRVQTVLADLVEALEVERNQYLETTQGRQLGLIEAEKSRSQDWRDRAPALGELPAGDR